ncbi:MAG TPA: type 4a pilus biogenesis protein PilO, partial [Luteimonas sp.]|nr:type 4a pilus biogenesis protein PilO [Luteimonas sp.]
MSRRKMAVKDLNFNNTGSWPREYKLVFCGIVAVVIIALAWWLFIRGKTEELTGLEKQETDLRAEFEKKQGRASNLEPLKLQLAQMEQQLQQMLRQLPSKTEMPDLIVDISQTALATGLTSELFREIGGVALPFGEDSDQHVGARHLVTAGRLDVNHRPLDDALETGGRFG